ERPATCQRSLVLRDLVSLRKIGIEVVLACEDRRLVDMAIERKARADGQIDCRSIQDRERAGKAETHWTHVSVRRGPKRRTAPTENLRRGSEVGVNLEADNGLKGHTEPWSIG